MEFLTSEQSFQILISLAPGYLAYCLYNIDADWREIRQTDVVYGSFIFSVLSFSCANFVMWIWTANFWVYLAITFASSLLIALVYRKLLQPLLYKVLRGLAYTNSDQEGTAWQKIFNEPKLYITQISAYLDNGEAVQCDDTREFDRPELRACGIYPYYSDFYGRLCFIFNRRRVSAEAEWQKVQDVSNDSWGFRIVYLNPESLKRLEVRVIPSEKQLSVGMTWIKTIKGCWARITDGLII